MATASHVQMRLLVRCPANCKCAKCHLAAAKLRQPLADNLQDVVERINLNHQRHVASPVDFVPPSHHCPCGLTFATALYLKAHVRNVHNGKVPDYHPLYYAGVPFFRDASPGNFPTQNAIGAVTCLPGELIASRGCNSSRAFAVLAASEYQNSAEGVKTKATSSRKEAAVKSISEGNLFRKRKESTLKSVLTPLANPVVSKANREDLQSTISFRCSQCLKLFPTRENLDVHFMRWHGAVPPQYSCRFCEREFPTLSARNTHTKTVHEPSDLFCSPISNDFDRILQSQNCNNHKLPQVAAKSDGNVSVMSHTVTSVDFNEYSESIDMTGLPSAGNSAQACPAVKPVTNWDDTETFDFGNDGDSSSAVTFDPLDSTDVTSPLRKSIANKINWIFNAKVANTKSDTTEDPIATPLNVTSTKLARQPDNINLTKQPCDQSSITMAPTNSDSVQVISSDSEQDLPDPLPIFLSVRKISTAVSFKDPRGQNVVACSPSDSAKKSSDFLVKSKREVNPKVQPSNLTTAKHSAVVANVPTLKSTEPPNMKYTLQSADNAKPQSTTALASGTSHNKDTPMVKQGSVNTKAQSLKLVMVHIREDHDSQQAGPRLRPRRLVTSAGATNIYQAVVKGLQKVYYIDTEGSICSMITEVDKPSQEPLYLCNICDAWFPGYTELLDHREENHVAKGSVKCKRCDRMFMSESLADCHEQFAHIGEIHDDIMAAADERRAKMFAKFWEAARRRAKRERREPWKEGEIVWDATNDNRGHFLCLICNICLDTKFHLQQHNITVHNKANFICDLCGKLMGTLKSLERHKLVCSMPETMVSCLVSCLKCNKKLSDERKLRKHMATSHSNVRNFECEVCKKRFNQVYNLRFHIKTQHNGERKYHTCPKCQKVFTALNSVRLHDIAAHLAYDCNFCDVTVIGKAELRDHVAANHRKPKGNKFNCGTCPKTFPSKSALVTHISAQHGTGTKAVYKKPAPSKELIFCDVCGKAYVIKASMVRHMSVKHGFVESYFVGEQREVKEARKRKSGTSGKKSSLKTKAKKTKSSATDSLAIDSGSMNADLSLDSTAKQAISDVAFQNNSDVENTIVQGSLVESPNSEISRAGGHGENVPPITQENAKPIASYSVPIDLGAWCGDVNLDPAAIQGISDATIQNTDAGIPVVESFNSGTDQVENEGVMLNTVTQGSSEMLKEMRHSVRKKKSVSNFIEETNTDFMVHMIDLMCKRNQ